MQNITKNALSTHTTAKKKKHGPVPTFLVAVGKDIVMMRASSQLKQADLDDALAFRRVGKISPM